MKNIFYSWLKFYCALILILTFTVLVLTVSISPYNSNKSIIYRVGSLFYLSDFFLNTAVKTNDIKLAEKLIRWGANPNLIIDKNQETSALMFASIYGYTEMVKLLIENGADVNLRDKNGATALTSSAWAGNADIVEILIKNKADINAKHNIGRTALWFAVAQNHSDVVEIIKKYGGKDLGAGETIK